MSKVRIYKVPSKAEREVAERVKAESVGLPYDKWISLDEKAREDLMVAVAAVKKKATRLVKKNERERHYAAAANMTLEDWQNLSKEDRKEKKNKIKELDNAARKEERERRRLMVEAERLKSDAAKLPRTKACPKKPPLQVLPGATRVSLITGLMDSPTNKKWEMFLYEGPYWTYLVNYITRTNIFHNRRDLVEDAVSTTFGKIAKVMGAKRYKYPKAGKGYFRAFIKCIAFREAVNLFKVNKRYEQSSSNWAKSDLDEIHEDLLNSQMKHDKKLAKMKVLGGIDAEIASVSDHDLDVYDASAGFEREIKPNEKSGARKKLHNIVSLDSSPFDEDEMPSNYSPADLFDYITNISKEDLKWVQKLQLHVLYIALGHVLLNNDISVDKREMLRLRYGCDWSVADIYALKRFNMKTRNNYDVMMNRATEELRKEAKSWWELVAPDKNDFANETVLSLWRKLSNNYDRAKMANDLQDKAIKKAGRIG